MSIAEQYIESVNRADIEGLMSLFSPTAALFHPAGEFTDSAAIRNFYSSVVFAGQANTEIQAAFTDGDTEILHAGRAGKLRPCRGRVQDCGRTDRAARHLLPLGVD